MIKPDLPPLFFKLTETSEESSKCLFDDSVSTFVENQHVKTSVRRVAKFQILFKNPDKEFRIWTKVINPGHKKQTRFFRIMKVENTAVVTKPDVKLR